MAGMPGLLYPVYLFAEDRGWDLKVWCVLVGLSYPILHALRGRLVMDGSTVRTRGIRHISPPVDLERLRAVGTFRSAGMALHVYVEDESGESMLLVPRYWAGWSRFRDVLAEHVERSGLAVGRRTAAHLRLTPRTALAAA